MWVTVKRAPAQRQTYSKIRGADQALVELLAKLGVSEDNIKQQVEICLRSSRV